MKKYALLVALSLSILSCEKKQDLPDPTVEFKIGYISDLGGSHIEYYLNQDTILRSDLDTALSVKVIEKNLNDRKLDSLQLQKLEFTVYINTLLDSEKVTTGSHVYGYGLSMGRNTKNEVNDIDFAFILPLRITDRVIINDSKIELASQSDYIRISYESIYTGLSKVKTIIIKD
jgi:hypothetical protein